MENNNYPKSCRIYRDLCLNLNNNKNNLVDRSCFFSNSVKKAEEETENNQKTDDSENQLFFAEKISKIFFSYFLNNCPKSSNFNEILEHAVVDLLYTFKISKRFSREKENDIKYIDMTIDMTVDACKKRDWDKVFQNITDLTDVSERDFNIFFNKLVECDMNDFLDDFTSYFSLEPKKTTSDTFTITKEEIKITEKEKKKKKDELYLTESHVFPYSKELSHICHLSKNLYNLGNFLTRMRYYFLQKPDRYSDSVVAKIGTELWDKFVVTPNFNFENLLSEYKKMVDNYVERLNSEVGKQNYHSVDPDALMDQFGIDKKLVEFSFKNKAERDDYYKIGVFMGYRELWDMVYYSPEFQVFGGQKGQQTLKILMDNWKGYFKLKALYNAEKKRNPRSNIAKPSIPRYLKKNGEFVVVFPRQSIGKVQETFSKKTTRGTPKCLTACYFSPKKLNLPTFKTTIPFELIREVCIVPKGNVYIIEVVYKKNKNINPNLDKRRIVSGDFGGINLLSIGNNFGDRPRIVKGGDIRVANYYAECQISQFTSNRDDLINSLKKVKKEDRNLYKDDIQRYQKEIDDLDKKIAPAWTRRNNRVKNILHQTTRTFINYCVDYRAGTIVYGYNDLWKLTMKHKMGKKTRKWFNSIPFYELCKMIEYKARLVGIEVIKVPEFKIDESGKRIGSSQTCSYCGKKGIRVKRGLFLCPHCGITLNADVNGAYNHLKWGVEGALNSYTRELFEATPIPLSKSLNIFNKPRALA